MRDEILTVSHWPGSHTVVQISVQNPY